MIALGKGLVAGGKQNEERVGVSETDARSFEY